MPTYPGPPTIPSDALEQLFFYLKSNQAPACACSLEATRQFLANHRPPIEETTQWFAEQGVDCDCQVLAGMWFDWPASKSN